MIGLTRGEYDSEERKRSKGEKVFLMTNEGSDDPRRSSSSVREAERRSLLRSIYDKTNFMQALNTCVKMLREGDERAKALLLLALLEIYQRKPMRVNMKKTVELEPMKKTD